MQQRTSAFQHANEASLVELAAMGPVSAGLCTDNPSEVMREIAQSLRNYANSRLPIDLAAISRDAGWLDVIAARSYRHANGFSKLVLTDSSAGRLRLHIWEPGANAEENVHEHRWHFASAVLTGRIDSEIWVDAFDRHSATFDEFIYSVQDGRAIRQPVGRTRAARTSTTSRQAGDAYFMLPGVMHRITRTIGVTATLVFTSAPSRSWNRMLASDGIQPNVDKCPLQASEVRRLLELLLGQMNEGGNRVHRH